jgi:hypothetical protein
MQKHNEPMIRKMPLPIDIEVVDGTSVSDGIVTLTHKETSHIRLLSLDKDNYLVYEITPPKKLSTKPSKIFFGEDQLIDTTTTVTSLTGKPTGQYKYYRRANGSYYALITGEKTGQHKIELGKFTERDSPISTIAKAIAYNFSSRKFSRKDLIPLIPTPLRFGQKLKSLLDTLHYEGYLTKEMAQTAKKKAKELYSATEKLKQVVPSSPSPEQT